MTRINKRHSKEIKFYKGKHIMKFPGIKKSEWNFTLLRSANGTVQDSIELDPEEEKELVIVQREILKETILECVVKNLVEWVEMEN